MQNCKKTITSINFEIYLKFDNEYQTTIKKIKKYQILIDNLIYFVIQIRFNITFVVQKLN